MFVAVPLKTAKAAPISRVTLATSPIIPAAAFEPSVTPVCTKAVVASCDVLVLGAAVGAVGAPVKAGLDKGA